MKLVKTSFFSAIITFIKIASGFIAGKVIALVTGPAGVALIGQFTNFVTIVLTFANGAINNGVVKYTAQYDGDTIAIKTLLSTSLKISFYCSLIVGFCLFATASYTSGLLFATPVYANPIKALGGGIVFYSLNTLLISILNGKKQIKTYTIVNTAGSLTALIFTIILAYCFKIQGALYALVLSQSVVFFITIFLVTRADWFSWSYFKQAYDKSIANQLFKFSLMAIVSALTLPLSQMVLRNIVISKLGINAAGYWQGLMRVSDGYLLLATTALSTYYLPKLSSLSSDADIRKEILTGYKIILPVVFVSCCAIYFLRFFIISVLYSADFRIMEELFLFQLIGDFFKIAAWILAYLMLAKSMTVTYIITEIVFSIGYVIIGQFSINSFGLNGITIAFAINYLIYFLSMLLIFKRTLLS